MLGRFPLLSRGRRGLGCFRDGADSRDRDLALMGLPSSAPSSATLARYAVPQDQGPTNSCVGWAIAQGIHVAAQVRSVSPGFPAVRFIYWNSRGYHGGEVVDLGTFPRTGLKGVMRFGAPLQLHCPWEPKRINLSPPWAAYRHAFDGRGARGYYRIFDLGDARLEAMRVAIAAGFPVVFGTVVDKAFQDHDGRLTVGPPRSWIGRHAMLAVGYEPGRFRVVNSWGRYWGEGGFCWLSEDYLAHRETADLWVIDVGGGADA